MIKLKELLFGKSDCDCGCGNCEGTKLNEQVKISENLQYHLDNKIPLGESIFRISSNAHVKLFKETRQLWKAGKITLSEADEYFMSTDAGKQGIYEGNIVPLDLPYVMEINNDPYISIKEDIKIYGDLYENLNINDVYPIKNTPNSNINIDFIFEDKHGIKRRLRVLKGNSIKLSWYDPSKQQWSMEDIPRKYEDSKVMNTFGMILVKVILPKLKSFNIIVLNTARYRLFRALIFNNLDTSKYQMNFDDKKLEIEVYSNLDEAKKSKKKNPPLNKPKRGGPKAYFVYVRDPKTKKIKKVTFGSGGLRAKISNKKASQAFAKRHNCDKAKDRTKASYWSCNLPRYAKMLGLGEPSSRYW